MGNAASVNSWGQDPKSVRTGWHSNKLTRFRLGLNAACRFTHQVNEVYNDMRLEREPWKTILANAADEFEEERRLQAEEENTESTELFHGMMMGMIPGKHIKRHGRECWVFVSSTFTDTRHERDLLMEDVYPYIRDYCREIGLSFNVVDFRWGIRATACNQHLSAQICLKEVQRCKENSVGPFFVGILGQKYGWRPIPYTLPETLYYSFLGSISRLAEQDPVMREAKGLIEMCFKIDENALDRIAVLQPIDSIYSKFSQNCPNAVGKWRQTFDVMRTALFTVIRGSGLPEEMINELTWSVTEGEIVQGLKDLDPNQPNRMFLFNRTLSNFNESQPNARNFIDQSQDGEIDGDSQLKLQELRLDLRKKMPEDAMYRYKLRFLPSSEEMINDEHNKEQLKKFLDQFCRYMMDSIREGALSEATAFDHTDYAEVVLHAIFCRERAEVFVGRSDILEIVMNHLEQPNGKMPYAIHGEGGTGKSSVLAKLYSNFTEKWENKEEGRPIMVIRFIGITPESSNIRDLLYSICLQLCYCFHLDVSTLPREYTQLESKFYNMLNLATAEMPIVIFLDALDQLTNENQAHDLNWLPSSLPNYVHMIVTVRPAAGGGFAKYKRMGNSDCSLELVPMDEKERSDMIELRLEKLGRCLTKSQMDYVKSAYGKGQPPALYIRLACDIASNWKSYTPMSECRLADCTMNIIAQRFEDLEDVHGKLFVSHALGYLTASNNGLSPNELLDVLSCDDDVLEDVFQYHVPPIRRLPVLLWTRLRLDLGDYLVESGADKMVVYRWYHRLFHVVAKNRYLSVNGKRIHENLANYFLGRWANAPKPYRIKGSSDVDIAHRRVQDQPLILDPTFYGESEMQSPRSGGTGQKKRYNMRKLSELPQHLIQAEMWKEAEQVMCSIQWCEAKCSTGRIYQLLDELSQAATKCDTEHQNNLNCFYRMIRANSQVLHRHPDLLCQAAINEPDSSTCVAIGKAYSKHIKEQVQYWADLSKSQQPDPEVMTFSHSAPVNVVSFSPMCKHVAVGCDNGTVRVWRVSSGAMEMQIENMDALSFAWPIHCFWLAILESDGIKIYGTGTAKSIAKNHLVCTMKADIEPVAKVYIPKQCKQLVLASTGRVELFNTSSGKSLKKYSLRCRPKAMVFDKTGKHLLMAHGTTICLYDYTKEEAIKQFSVNDRLTNFDSSILAYSHDGRHIMGILPVGTYMWKANKKSGAPEGNKLMLNCRQGPCAVSPNLDYIASIEGENYCKVLRLKPDVEWCRLEAHKQPVTCADFGTTSNYLFLATGSKDHMVRIWDAGSFTGHVAAKTELPPNALLEAKITWLEYGMLEALLDMLPPRQRYVYVHYVGSKTYKFPSNALLEAKITWLEYGMQEALLDMLLPRQSFTGSKDHMVRIWDAGSFTGHVAAKTEHHTSKVTGCVFSSDGTKAASSSRTDGAWLWDCTVTPPRITLFLSSRESCKELHSVACMSDDGEFVAGFCNEHDIDVWNTNSPRLSNKITVQSAHRMMPYVNPQYFFLMFNKALMACFMTSNRFGVVVLAEVISEACLKDWRANPEREPSFYEYAQETLEFDHTANFKVMDAALRYDGTQLVTVSKKLAETNLLDTLITRKRDTYMDGAVLVNIWNVHNQEIILKCTVADKLTRFHCVGFLTTFPMIFMQEDFKEVNVNNARPRTGRAQRPKQTSYTVTRILNPESGEVVGKLTIQGEYDTLKIPVGTSIQGQITLQEAMERIKISCMTRDGVFMSTNLIKNNPMAKFVLKESIATSYAFSSDNQTCMVGFDTGSVRFLRLENIKKKTFLVKS
ncbi:NACHT and WD repeat domain-containing protein 2-like [Amphiura filiformis]|uniref:NACHT and WD repeat domain-containing protein 2-like n=1 Tax=Amphiura filiformis TaxID=82378 RepID=UPI003B20BE71